MKWNYLLVKSKAAKIRHVAAKCIQQKQELIKMTRDRTACVPISCFSKAELLSTFGRSFTAVDFHQFRQIELTSAGDSLFILIFIE